jgi:outer membrane protein TolC
LANANVSSGAISIAMPIFTGGRVRYGDAQVAAGVDALQALADAKRRDIAFQTVQAYLAAVLAQRVAEVTVQAYQTVKDHVQSAQSLFNHGQIPRYEVIRAQTEQANADRRRLDAHNQADLALAYLQELMGIPYGDAPQLTTDLDGNAPLEVAIDTMVKQSLASSNEMQALQARDRLYVATEKEARAEKNPLVSGVATEKVFMNAQPFSSPSTIVGLEVNVPLDDGGLARAKMQEQESLRARNHDDTQALQNGIRLAVHKDYLDLLNAREALNAADQAIALAQEGLRLATRRFAEQEGTDLEINDAVLALSLAQTNREQARYQYDLAYYGLKMLMGELISTVLPGEGAANVRK